MKVLLAFPFADGETGIWIKKAFQQHHIEVIPVDAKLAPNTLYYTAASVKPDIVFCSRTAELYDDICKLEYHLPEVCRICWNVDARNSIKDFGFNLSKLFNKMHIFYCKPKGLVVECSNLFVNTRCDYLLEGIDPDIHNKMPDGFNAETVYKYACEVMFIGNRNTLYMTPPGGRIELLNHLKTQSEFVFKEIVGAYKEYHSKLCQIPKIVLGHTGFSHIALSNSGRDFRVMGAGAFLLTEYVDGIEEIFVPGEHCATYKSKEECVDKIKYYLKHEDERKKIAAAGFELVHTKHTFKDRISKVIQDYNRWKHDTEKKNI